MQFNLVMEYDELESINKHFYKCLFIGNYIMCIIYFDV